MGKAVGYAALGVFAVAAGVFLAAATFARRVVIPATKRKEDLRILGVSLGTNGSLLIELPATERTMAPGRYSIWFAGGTGHACIGAVAAVDFRAGTVTRLVERVDSGDLSRARAGIWSGYVFPTPEPLGLPYSDIEIPVEGGTAPAWKFDPADASNTSRTWAIHVHGMGGTRAGALRGVPAAQRLGFTSLLVSYRNDGEAPASVDGRYSLGHTEWHDIEPAIAYALEHGARKVLLFGWSLGGSICLQLAARSKYRDRIAGLVLDAPVINWSQTLMANARAARLPSLVALLGLQMLGSHRMRWITGFAEPLDLPSINRMHSVKYLHIPILILHGENDSSTNFEVSKELADRLPDRVELVPFPSGEHTQEWNLDPERWETAVQRWAEGLLLHD